MSFCDPNFRIEVLGGPPSSPSVSILLVGTISEPLGQASIRTLPDSVYDDTALHFLLFNPGSSSVYPLPVLNGLSTTNLFSGLC